VRVCVREIRVMRVGSFHTPFIDFPNIFKQRLEMSNINKREGPTAQHRAVYDFGFYSGRVQRACAEKKKRRHRRATLGEIPPSSRGPNILRDTQ